MMSHKLVLVNCKFVMCGGPIRIGFAPTLYAPADIGSLGGVKQQFIWLTGARISMTVRHSFVVM